MNIYNSIYDFSSTGKTVVTLGTFDGVHKGHHKILEKLVNASRGSGCQSVVLTFFPHPRMVLQQDSDIKLLNTINERALLLEQAGIDNLIIHPFNHAFSRLTAEEFVKDILVDRLNIQKIIIGYDHRFGRNRTATINDLIVYGQQFGFEVEQIGALEVNEVSVSSTKIRNALTAGDIQTANSFLGYPYMLTGTVVKGRQLGRTIGYPTANIAIPENYKLVPETGVYIASAIIDGTEVPGMMSIGTNPTVGGMEQSIEIHLFDFDDDLYGKTLQLNLHKRLRNEEKFASIEILKDKLDEDRQLSLAYYNQK